MEVKAKAKYIRMSPRKVRLVADVVRGLRIDRALNQLYFLHKRATVPVKKVVESAVANAEHNYELDKNNLYIKEIRVDEGRTLHRFMPRAYGRATPIRKRTSHINVTLGEIVDSGEVKSKTSEPEAPVSLQDMAGQSGEGGAQSEGKTEKQEKKKKTSSSGKKESGEKKEKTAAGKEQGAPQEDTQKK